MKGRGEKSALCGLGAEAIDSVMLVGSPGMCGRYETSREAASVAGGAAGAAGVEDDDAPFECGCSVPAAVALAGSLLPLAPADAGAGAGDSCFGLWRVDEGAADMVGVGWEEREGCALVVEEGEGGKVAGDCEPKVGGGGYGGMPGSAEGKDATRACPQ